MFSDPGSAPLLLGFALGMRHALDADASWISAAAAVGSVLFGLFYLRVSA